MLRGRRHCGQKSVKSRMSNRSILNRKLRKLLSAHARSNAGKQQCHWMISMIECCIDVNSRGVRGVWRLTDAGILPRASSTPTRADIVSLPEKVLLPTFQLLRLLVRGNLSVLEMGSKYINQISSSAASVSPKFHHKRSPSYATCI